MASAHDSPGSGASGSRAVKPDQSSIPSSVSSHASCSIQSGATVVSEVLSKEPGVTILGESSAPASSAIASRKRRPACEVGTITSVDGSASRSAKSSSAAKPRKGFSQPTNTRSIVIEANPNKIRCGLNQIHHMGTRIAVSADKKIGPEPMYGSDPGKSKFD